MTYENLRLILRDQLNANHSWFKHQRSDTLYLIAELKQELTYTQHHGQKICAFLLAMEAFAQALKAAGHQVLYLTLDKTQEHADLVALIRHLCHTHAINKVEYQRPDEYRLYQQLSQADLGEGIALSSVDSEHFLLPFNEIDQYFSAKKAHKMEFFYRKMRQRFNLLMDRGQPLGGQWNYDADNRNKLKPADLAAIPAPLTFSHSTRDILQRLQRHHIPYFGRVDEHLIWPSCRREALQLLEHFCRYCLPYFGRFQDAMTCQSEHQWSLYHSRLSFALNAKLLHPLQVIQAAIAAYKGQGADKQGTDNKNTAAISLPQIEGFVRQILGWREYIRGVYWVNMPDYAHHNHLDAQRPLPHYFWSGKTQMRCMQAAIQQSLDYSYAHHIQRLMVTGNFCLLTGIDPQQVDDWYLGIYIDAIEWVEMPNTRGMSQFADGGLVATKPYVASGNYIHKMSDYCQHCHYQVKAKTGEQACPFNSLYWHFMTRHRPLLEKNPRIGMVYRNWDKQAPEQQQATLARAAWCLDNLEDL